jgi:hypothetical protein
MKLRKADVENLRAELSGGEVVDLGEVKEELVFEDDVELVDDTGMATQEIVDVETVIEDDVVEVGPRSSSRSPRPSPRSRKCRRRRLRRSSARPSCPSPTRASACAWPWPWRPCC